MSDNELPPIESYSKDAAGRYIFDQPNSGTTERVGSLLEQDLEPQELANRIVELEDLLFDAHRLIAGLMNQELGVTEVIIKLSSFPVGTFELSAGPAEDGVVLTCTEVDAAP